MKRILLTLKYDGTSYHGWQVQPNGITVQETLQDGLQKVLGKRTGVTGCSRTDAGVHAQMFCCHLDCDDSIPDNAFLLGLNSVLPEDITVIDCKKVSSDFHARYSSTGKTYIYRIYCGKIHDPFIERYAWHIDRDMNIDDMNLFCGKIVGTHDFLPFSSSGRTVEKTVRTVSECFVEKNENTVILKITADGFLYNMVRIIVGTAVEVSFGRLPYSIADDIFKFGKRELAGITAPPKGLFLNKVYYPEF